MVYAYRVSPFALISRRLPHAVVVAYLGIAAFAASALPLVPLWINRCVTLPVSVASIGSLIFIVVWGTVVGSIPVYVYNRWSVRKGLCAWCRFASADTSFSSPGWREAAWWILVAVISLPAGAIAGALLQKLL